MWPVPAGRRSRWGEDTTPMAYSFNRWLNDLWDNLPEASHLVGTYPVDVEEQNGSITVEAEMPGFKKDEITITVDGDVMRIAAERDIREPEGKRHLRERRFARVDRVLTLPAYVDEKGAKANLEDGVLRVELPKAEGARTHRIEVR
jgi:HSP20 family protein